MNPRLTSEEGTSACPPMVIAITSGKGGVGKTNVVVNLGYSLSAMGKKVLIIDADMSLGNIDLLLGLAPRYNISHYFSGMKEFGEIAVEGPLQMKIIPASSGIQELSELTEAQRKDLMGQLRIYMEAFDIVLVDTAAGISSNVMSFNSAADEIVVIASPEPTSITDAYALMKVLSLKYAETSFKLVVNCVSNAQEALEVFRHLTLVSDKFLDISVEYFGYIEFDDKVKRSVKRQKLVREAHPDSGSSLCFDAIARRICRSHRSSKGRDRVLQFGTKSHREDPR